MMATATTETPAATTARSPPAATACAVRTSVSLRRATRLATTVTRPIRTSAPTRTVARCGDSIVRDDLAEGEPGYEACDDGNEADDDGCVAAARSQRAAMGLSKRALRPAMTATKITPTPASAVVRAPHAAMDLPKLALKAATMETRSRPTPAATAAIRRCGDGVVQGGVEACDDGNQVETDACRTNCVAARCGDGIVQAGVEACDDGNNNDNDLCSNNCREISCGDNGGISADYRWANSNCDSGPATRGRTGAGNVR